MKMQARTLFIHYYFPPTQMVSSARMLYWYRLLDRQGHRIWGMGARNRHRFPQDTTLETGCAQLIDLPAYDLRSWVFGRKQYDSGGLGAVQKRKPWLRALLRWVDSFPLNILLGDGGVWYIWTGYLAGQKLVRDQGITHLFSSFRPYADHLVAYLLKWRFPHLIWMADFRDLHVDPLRRNVCLAGFQRWCNRLILKKADRITTVSAGLARQLQLCVPPNTRIDVVRTGLTAPIRCDTTPYPSTFRLVYTGSLYADWQRPEDLALALESLDEQIVRSWEITYAGRDGELWKQTFAQSGWSGIIRLLGCISRSEALQLQRTAAVNILLTWSSPQYSGILTGKLYEYLAARRPILILINGPRDTEWDTLFGHRPGVWIWSREEGVAALAKLLAEAHALWQKGLLPAPYSPTELTSPDWLMDPSRSIPG